jgi:serine/threonine-protein kinase RsbT
MSGDFAKQPSLAPRLHNDEGGAAPTMQATDVLLSSERSQRRGGFEVPVVGSKRVNDRSNHSNTNSSPAVRVQIGTDADIVVARQQGRALANAMQFSATDSAFIATTVSELARALLSNTVRGEIWLHKVYEHERSGVVIVARDPVSRPVSRNGSDSGVDRHGQSRPFQLPEVYRLVDEYDVASEAGHGTTIRATKWCRRR